MSQKTPLNEIHRSAGGRMVDFAGWDMPVQYTGILDEHKAVRESCGIFDISHMGEFFVKGPGATRWLQGILTNDLQSLQIGASQYSFLLNREGGVIDDLIVYRLAEEEYLLIVNASKIEEDASWLNLHLDDAVTFENRSVDFAALAIQGPSAYELAHKVLGLTPPEERNRVLQLAPNQWLATTGYTGEAGFELVVPADTAAAFWTQFVEAGAKPCGLGSRDTLRLEMCYPLNGSDLAADISPLEAGLGFFVNFNKGDFIGRDALLAQKEVGLKKKLTALKVVDKAPPIRPHYPVVHGGLQVSETTSGALSPSLGYGIALTYLPPELSREGTELEIDVRGKRYRAIAVKKPFYKKLS